MADNGVTGLLHRAERLRVVRTNLFKALMTRERWEEEERRRE